MNATEQEKDTVFNKYSDYLAECIADMRFMDKDNLKQYLRTHLNLFYSECLDSHLLSELDNRYQYLLLENQKLAVDRLEMEEQLLAAKSDLRQRRRVDLTWMAKLNYAFKMKGMQISNNNIEVRKIADLKKARNIEIANSFQRAKLDCLRAELTEMFGRDKMMEIADSSLHRLHDKFKKYVTYDISSCSINK